MDMLSPWIDAVGWTLLHFLWQGILIGGAWVVLRTLLPRQASEWRHATGLLALAALALAPILTLVRLWPEQAAAAASAAALDGAIGTAVSAMHGSPGRAVDALLPWLVAVWAIGVCGLAVRALLEWRRLDHIVRRCARAHAQIDALFAAVNARFGIVQRVRALVSDQVDTPMLIGWLRPVILLPTAVALGFPRQQVELILAHELGHLRRCDHLVNLVQTVLETVLFYHPVVHWISREVRNERELCCDHLVLRTMQGEPHEYARTLAALEELRLATPFALAASGGDLLERVRRIVGVSSPRVAVEGRGSGRWLLIAAGLMLAWTLVQRSLDNEAAPLVVHGPGVDWVSLQMPSVALAPALLATPIARLGAPRIESVDMPIAARAENEPSALPKPAAAEPVAAAATAVVASATGAARELPTELASAAVPAPKSELALPAAVPAHVAKPVALHTVVPEFPGNAYATRVEVEASFSIAADGSVRDIRLNGRADKAFRRAAEIALRQWRFDPASLPAGAPQRYTQVFVFAPPGEHGAEDGCVRPMGSMICQAPPTAAGGESTSAGG